MIHKKITLLFLSISFLGFLSCSNDDPLINTELPKVSIGNLSETTEVAQQDTLLFKANIHSETTSEFNWLINGIPSEQTDSVFRFIPTEIGSYTISLSCNNEAGTYKADVQVTVYGKYRHGTWILNEGNMTTENGSLIFISPKGAVTDSAYFRANGTYLGNATQDLFIKDGKIYIISQNGNTNAMGSEVESDGMLVVANSETLKRQATYNEQLAELSWPTHIAVLNESNIFIRDNKGIFRFNSLSGELTFVEGSESARKNTMAVTRDKVFASSGKTLLVLEADKTNISASVELDANISGVITSADNNVWVSTASGQSGKIYKINARDYSVIKVNTIPNGVLRASFAATPSITAKGDTLYFSGLATKIYRHVFSTGETEFLLDAKTRVDNANIVYNTIAVHPRTGYVYMNTIKAYGWDFLINNISIFNLGLDVPTLEANYQDYTHFPAGIFFTDNFGDTYSQS